MSVEAITWAFSQTRVGSTDKFVLVAIANAANAAGVGFPGQRHVAEQCGIVPDTAGRALRRLEGERLLARVERRRDNGSRTSDWVVLAPCGGAARAPMSGPVAQEHLPLPVVALIGSHDATSYDGGGGDDTTLTGGPDPLVNRQASPSSEGDVARVFDEWIQSTGRTGQTRLDSKRRRIIEKALASHGLDDCLEAVRKIGTDAWARGKNKQGQRYDDIVHALGDAARLERWRDQKPRGGQAPAIAGAGALASQAVTPALHSEWSRLAALLAQRVDNSTFQLWLSPLHLHESTVDRLVVGCLPDRGQWLRARFASLISELADGRAVAFIECRCPQEQAA